MPRKLFAPPERRCLAVEPPRYAQVHPIQLVGALDVPRIDHSPERLRLHRQHEEASSAIVEDSQDLQGRREPPLDMRLDDVNGVPGAIGPRICLQR
eukprot:scaffold7182_cov258-Pinguiococcus_pyrenoidosus.AAC.2